SVNLALLHGLRDHGYKGRVAVTTHTTTCARQLKKAGADLVLLPYADAAAEAVDNLFGVIDRQP
ncbi:MAG: sodium:proton exchanger, partial [Gammaproteobacteria bacterium]|nr:sodium:proton exchanger [Gammaproteobacteria bacterium]